MYIEILEFKHRPNDGIAIRAERFTKNQMLKKKMEMEKFETNKEMKKMYGEKKKRRVQKQQKEVGSGSRINGMKENAIARIKKWTANKRSE